MAVFRRPQARAEDHEEMKLQQLRYLLGVIECGLSVSQGARNLNTSQSGVSRYLRLLEDELGTELFVREDNRLVALTEAGEEVARIARRMLRDAQTIRNVGRAFGRQDTGELIIATAHTHARYTLPPILEKFMERFPRIGIRLRQGVLSDIMRWTLEGTADFFIGTVPRERDEGLALVPCHETHRIVIVPTRHPLLAVESVTLEKLVEYPLITYDPSFSVQLDLVEAFRRRGLKPTIVLTASDSEVIKAYVRTGIGVTVLSRTVFNTRHDVGLRAIDARHMFGTHSIYVGFRKHEILTEPMLYFMNLYAPSVRRETIKAIVYADRDPTPADGRGGQS